MSKVLRMLNKFRRYAISVVSGLAILLMTLGTGCEEPPKKEAGSANPKMETVKKAEPKQEHKSATGAGDRGKKAEGGSEKAKPSSGQPGRGTATDQERDTRIFKWRRDLTSPDRDFRSFAALSLLRSGDPASVEMLIAMLGNAPDDIRMTTIRAFQFEGNDAAAQPLIALLSDQNPDVRQTAAEALGTLESSQAIELMSKTLGDNTKSVAQRAALAGALGMTHKKQAIEPLISILAEKDPVLRKSAVDALFEITRQKDFGDDQRKWQEWWELNKGLSEADILRMALEAYKIQEKLLKDAFMVVSDAMAQGVIDRLNNRPDKNDATELIKESKNMNPKVKVYVAQELGKIIGKIRSDAAFNTLVGLLSDPEEDVRIAAAGALGDSGDKRAVDPMLHALKNDSRPQVRAACAKAFGKSPSPKALNQLEDSLNDPNVDVVIEAANALGQLGDTTAVAPVIGLMSDTNRPIFARHAAAGALGNLHDRRAVAPLIEMLRDSDDRLRWLATEALGKLGDTEAVSPLCHVVVADGSPSVRERAAISLGSLRDKEAIDPLCTRVNDPDGSVSKAAVEALFTIAGDASERLMHVGQVLMAKPDYPAAARFFEKLVEKYADKVDHADEVGQAKESLAKCYAKTGELKKARPILEELYRDPSKTDLRPLLARARIQDKEYKGAANLYIEGLKQSQGPEQLQASWSELYKLLDEHFSEMDAGDMLGVIEDARGVDPKFGGGSLEQKFHRLQKRAEEAK